MATFGKLAISDSLVDFVADALLPGTGVTPDHFWSQLEAIVTDLKPRNDANLARRDELQALIDEWHVANRDGFEHGEYVDFLRDIGYLKFFSGDVEVATDGVDPEIASIAGPQLVVPLDNSRYALNAANARWGSFYDALYGTDAIDQTGDAAPGKEFNHVRGDLVVARVRAFLDEHFALAGGSHASSSSYEVVDGNLSVVAGDGTRSALGRPEQFVAYTGDPTTPDSVLLRTSGLGLIIAFDGDTPIGERDQANIADVYLESAITAIMDCEDSVSAVDVEDKLTVYGNWLGLMTGKLTSSFSKGGKTVERALESDKVFTAAGGGEHVEPGRALMLVRNVGHHLSTDSVLFDGAEIPETFLDALVTVAAAMHDLKGLGVQRNSRDGSVYVVKPKMHGPDEVALACDLFSRVEDALGLDRNTIKMGIMDEERRTSLSLKECISIARDRLVFINTGFLDRTGDEIHTDMEAGPVLPKGEMKGATWLQAYEDSNVDTGLACGLLGRAQIGKGMWAAPSNMAEMLEAKIGHPMSGATTAWVPSPTAATLHATHYFQVDVSERQRALSDRAPGDVDDMTAIPLIPADRTLSEKEIQRELENNVQGILGYVVRWVGQGVGCSTVPDIDDVGLMEDLATLRISSQHVANWLHHGLLSEDAVRSTMQRMAEVVDAQNAGDDAYTAMAPNVDDSIPFQAALALVLEGRVQNNGYTEQILRRHRRELKDQ